MPTQTKSALVLVALTAGAAAIGCSTGSRSGPPVNGATGAALRASLHRAKSCGDLLADLKADAAYKVNRAIDRQIEQTRKCMQKYGEERCTGFGYAGVATDARAEASAGSFSGSSTSSSSSGSSSGALPPSSPAPSSGSSSSGGTAGSGDKSSSAGSYSETNTQVKGVDEADIVKNDGKNLYVIHGRAFKVVNAWPATDLKEAGTIDIEGQPSEMFVSDGKVVVYSQVNGAAIFKAANVTPKQQYQDFGYGYYPGGDVGVGGVAKTAPAYPGGFGPTTVDGVTYAPLTKVTVLTLNGTTPSVSREIYVEGNYLDSRRVGTNVRTVFQSYQYGPKLKYSVYELYPTPAPNAGVGMPEGSSTSSSSGGASSTSGAPYVDPYPKTASATIAALEQLRAANLGAIEATQLGDWLPYTFVRYGNGISTQSIACEDFYVPTVGSTQGGMTSIASIDLADPSANPRQTAILGQADTVYANADSLYLAAHAWVEPPFFWNDPYEGEGSSSSSSGATVGSPPSIEPAPPTPSPAPAPGGKSLIRPLTTPTEPPPGIIAWSSNNTHVHKLEFTTDPKFANYVASGTIVGGVKDQFSLDEKDGVLRIATTENRQYVSVDGRYVQPDFANGSPTPPARPNTVNHVYTVGQGGPWLDVLGSVGDLAPNERIYSVRFVESRGYVVTFRQVDPLFVIDLSQPKSPNVLASLKIPGFSEYMHPLGPNHLLTIGRDATDTGRQQGLQLQIFDVTNGASPVVLHKFTYSGQEYGSSDAEYDHKAFTYFADKNLLAFPYFANSYDPQTGANTMRSSLELFRVDLASGFSKLGSIDHTPLVHNYPNGYCGGWFGPSVRRGVFLENVVYAISYGGIVAKDVNNLAAAGNQLTLPNPMLNEGYGPVCAGL